MSEYYGQYAPELTKTFYAEEMWTLFEAGELTVDTALTGHYEQPADDADVDSVLEEIKAAFAEEQERQERVKEANDPLSWGAAKLINAKMAAKFF
jgi:RIO kinase 1